MCADTVESQITNIVDQSGVSVKPGSARPSMYVACCPAQAYHDLRVRLIRFGMKSDVRSRLCCRHILGAGNDEVCLTCSVELVKIVNPRRLCPYAEGDIKDGPRVHHPSLANIDIWLSQLGEFRSQLNVSFLRSLLG